MQTTLRTLFRGAGLACVGAVLALPGLWAADSDKNPDAFPTFDSYIKFSGYAPAIHGDKAAFAPRNGFSTSGSGGVEDFFYSKDGSNGVAIKMNGHALVGAEDYLFDLNLSKDGVGSVDVGYKRFRTFYDGVGGFFPLTGLFQTMGPEALHIDRGSFFFDAKFARPNMPVFTVSFHQDVRTGTKDSSEWGAIVNPAAVVTAGALVGTAAPANTPFIQPNVMTVSERHRTLEAGAQATVGKVKEDLKVTFEWVGNTDGRAYVRYPNGNALGVIADPTVAVVDDLETVTSKTFRVTDKIVAPIMENLSLEIGLNYSRVSAEDGGQWITPAYNTTAKAIFQTVTAGNIYTNARVDDYVGNVFLKFEPVSYFKMDLGFRDEYNVISDGGSFIVTSLASGQTVINAANTNTATDLTYSHLVDHVATPEVSLQYTGINKLSIYASFDKRINHGSQHWVNPYAAVTTTGTGVVTTALPSLSSAIFFQDANQDYVNAKVGANWNASSFFTFRAEVFRKEHQNKFIGSNDVVGAASYGAYYATGYNFTGVNLTLVVKPTPELSFTTRFQPQYGDMSVLGDVAITGGSGNEITSGKSRINMISESIDWAPTKELYLQGNLNMIYDYIQTSYPDVVVSTTSNIPVPFQNADNNSVTCSGLVGFVLTHNTDMQLQGMWQRANNYNPQISLGGIPYGASYEINNVNIGVKHKFNDHLVGEGKVGYFNSKSDTTGGFTNYRGPLFYFSIQYAL